MISKMWVFVLTSSCTKLSIFFPNAVTQISLVLGSFAKTWYFEIVSLFIECITRFAWQYFNDGGSTLGESIPNLVCDFWTSVSFMSIGLEVRINPMAVMENPNNLLIKRFLNVYITLSVVFAKCSSGGSNCNLHALLVKKSLIALEVFYHAHQTDDWNLFPSNYKKMEPNFVNWFWLSIFHCSHQSIIHCKIACYKTYVAFCLRRMWEFSGPWQIG